jgi:hypothetical protein
MAFRRDPDGADGRHTRPVAALRELRHDVRAGLVAAGTLACPDCDAPVALAGPAAPAAALACPWCGHGAPLREFLSLAVPTRPARVEVRISLRA